MVCQTTFLCYSFAVEDQHQQIEELKQLVRRNIELSTETSKMVHKLHTQARWGAIFRVLRIAVLVALAGGLYIYLSPYVASIRAAYEQIKGFVPGL